MKRSKRSSSKRGVGSSFLRLVKVMDRLRDEGGCPWDREQNLESIKPFLIEECYEILSAIDKDDVDGHREELGDLLHQIVFQARLRSEEGSFTISDVIEGITDKLIKRHPHVFSNIRVDSSKEVLKNWERLKREEKGERDTLSETPQSLPSLLRTVRITEKASRLGFDWENMDGVLKKIEEELGEFMTALKNGSYEDIEEEYGDILFALANLGRFIDINPEFALQKANERFIERFRYIMERLREEGRSPSKGIMKRMDELWEESKVYLKKRGKAHKEGES